ncbi:hypothetical protein PIB30_058855 [Stylosanthes scabra]|uniref:Oxo-4-hydroxy-4-carboxy-5-ureidoimidazoline decarboxylase domain-containing protein n=1 Tax=Stylosanthes scabra TaxID=79078 RepID=A0ABU6QKJ1_9FABA|nr:hypothetical protein [Stylosanthes scabra]
MALEAKGSQRGSQEVRNRAPCSRTVPSCDLTCPWEHFRMNSANTRATVRELHEWGSKYEENFGYRFVAFLYEKTSREMLTKLKVIVSCLRTSNPSSLVWTDSTIQPNQMASSSKEEEGDTRSGI